MNKVFQMRYFQMRFLLCGITFLMIILSCEGAHEKGTVSFASNLGIVNCPLEAHLFINNIPFGAIPNTVDSIADCNSSSNLRLKLPVGYYKFKVVISSQSGGCNADTSGGFEISKEVCTSVFIDIRELLK